MSSKPAARVGLIMGSDSDWSVMTDAAQALADFEVPFEVGVSRYRELARGQILGDTSGILKLLVSPVDRTLLGVHAFGTGATELVHIGQRRVVEDRVDEDVDRPAHRHDELAESYKVAALDATNKLRQLDRLED